VSIFLLAWNKEERWVIRTVKEYFQKSSMYHKFHALSAKTNGKQTEILLEIGNYAWGGSEAILILETQDEVKLYSYLYYQEEFRFSENVVEKGEFAPIKNGIELA
jgi:hypothetical protein